jgi:hypothetical protein
LSLGGQRPAVRTRPAADEAIRAAGGVAAGKAKRGSGQSQGRGVGPGSGQRGGGNEEGMDGGRAGGSLLPCGGPRSGWPPPDQRAAALDHNCNRRASGCLECWRDCQTWWAARGESRNSDTGIVLRTDAAVHALHVRCGVRGAGQVLELSPNFHQLRGSAPHGTAPVRHPASRGGVMRGLPGGAWLGVGLIIGLVVGLLLPWLG